MDHEKIHLLIIVCIIAGAACWFGFKAGTYYGSNKELVKFIKDNRDGKF